MIHTEKNGSCPGIRPGSFALTLNFEIIPNLILLVDYNIFLITLINRESC